MQREEQDGRERRRLCTGRLVPVTAPASGLGPVGAADGGAEAAVSRGGRAHVPGEPPLSRELPREGGGDSHASPGAVHA